MKKPLPELLEFAILNIDKPSGPTSFNISDFVRKELGVRKTSHFGTLDPKVTGVLPIALNRACKLTGFFIGHNKEYVGIMRIHKEVELKEIEKIIKKKFTGVIKQTPPVRSRVKRQEREREIISFEILEQDENKKDFLFKTKVQGGTYIRKLCLHPNTEIISPNGLIKIKDINSSSKVYSIDNKKLEIKRPSETQQILTNKLLKLKMSSGIEIIATPEHKMLISKDKGYEMIECRNLREGECIVKSNYLPIPTRDYVIADMLDDDYLIEDNEIKEKCKEAFIKKFGSIRAMNRSLKFDRKAFLSNSKYAISIKHLKLAGIYDKLKGKLTKFKTPKGKIIQITQLTKNHFYLLGLLSSDGNNTREKKTKRFTRIKFHNINETLIDNFYSIYTKLFPTIKISKKIIKDNLFQLDSSNSLFASIASKLGVVSPNKNSDILPILYCKDEFIKAFLRGYFDGDGNAYFKKKVNSTTSYSSIRIFSVNYINIKRIHQMLLKLKISSKIWKNKMNMYIININSIPSKKRFIEEIGTNHPRKKLIFEVIAKITCNSLIEDENYIGLHFKKFIREKKSKLSKMGGNLWRVLNNKLPITYGFYRKCSEIVDLPKIDNFIIEKINKIEIIDSSLINVFDMTIPNTHNFLIETGYISSNCDDLGKELGCGAHMLELRRTSAGIFSEDDKSFIDLYKLDKIANEFKDVNKNGLINKKLKDTDNSLNKVGLTDNKSGWASDFARETKINDNERGRELGGEELRKILIPAEEALKKIFPVVQVKSESVKRLLTGKPILQEDLVKEDELTNKKIDLDNKISKSSIKTANKISDDINSNKIIANKSEQQIRVGDTGQLGGAKINEGKFIAFCDDKFIGIYDNGKPLFVFQEIK